MLRKLKICLFYLTFRGQADPAVGGVAVLGRRRRRDCPPGAQKPPFWAVKRPARPYKTAIEKRVYYCFTTGKQQGRVNALAGPDS